MTLTQTAPKPATTIKIWDDASPVAVVGDIIRKPFCPIARVVGKEILADGRTCLIVTFPGCHDRHVEEWVLEAPAFTCEPVIAQATAPAIPTASKPAAASHTAPATASHTAPATVTIPAATGTNNGDEPPNRGDNGRGRVQPVPAKKLNLSLVAVKRIVSDVPASNFDSFELEVAGELSLTLGGFIIPPVLVRDSSGYKVIAGHFQYHAAVLARRLNPRAAETIPAIVLESENQATASAMLKMLKFAA
jgi:hypothetical protein